MPPLPAAAGYNSISWNYFDTFKIPLLRGRNFTEQDNGSAPGVVIINEAMARQILAQRRSAQGPSVMAGVGGAQHSPNRPRQIIGVVGDTHDIALNLDPCPTMYIPIAQMPDAETALNSRVAPLWWINSHQCGTSYAG